MRYLSSRWAKHVWKARHTPNSPITHAIRMHGVEAFSLHVLAISKTLKKADELESKFITIHKTMFPNGYNLTSGGIHGERHEVTKQRISKTKMGHFVSAKTRRKLKLAWIRRRKRNAYRTFR